ncbi:MAG: NADH-quinone oxidoreductase subunit N [Candidatus Methanomethylicia archaeon]
MPLRFELILNLTASLLIGAGVTIPLIDQLLIERKRKQMGYLISMISLILALLLNTLLIFSKEVLSPGILTVDSFGIIIVIAATFSALLVLIASVNEVGSWPTSTSYYSLIPIALLGIYYISFANDILLIFTSWMLTSVASYVIAGLRKDESSVEGAIKYSIMGMLSTVTMLYAIALLYGVSGTTNLYEIEKTLKLLNEEKTLLVKISLIMFIASLGFKFGIFPFHTWLPDVYGGVHPICVAYLAGVVEILPIAAFVRLLSIFSIIPTLQATYTLSIFMFSMLTMIFGNLVALVQKNVQRMLAYSTIAHAGYFLVGFTAFSVTKPILGTSASIMGLQGIALHLITYIIAKTGLFVALSYILRKIGNVDLISIRNLGRILPVTSFSASILLLSLMGIPPLIGFWSKLLLFLSVAGEYPSLTLVAALNSGISVAYYIVIIKNMYFTQNSTERQHLERIKDPEVIITIVTSLLTVILGLGIAPYIATYITLLK